uniref:Protein phosphatase 2 regulatory subunit Bgamma n=1 Tax=Sphaeramia orbicularis TaxID=375764 RepID=A0A673AJV6_9TELE
MGEDTDATPTLNHRGFLPDHNYVTEADIISTVEFNHTGELLATGDKGGRVVIFQREPEVCTLTRKHKSHKHRNTLFFILAVRVVMSTH